MSIGSRREKGQTVNEYQIGTLGVYLYAFYVVPRSRNFIRYSGFGPYYPHCGKIMVTDRYNATEGEQTMTMPGRWDKVGLEGEK